MFVLLPVLLVAGALFDPRVRLAALVVAGRSPHCPLPRAVESAEHLRLLIETKDRILAGSRLVEVDPDGFRLWDTPKGRYWIPPGTDYGLPFNLAELELRIYGADQRGVRAGDVVLDCGAFVGAYTRHALEAGATMVVAVEPSPLNLECLRRNLREEIAAGRVVVYPKGVWNEETELTLHIHPENRAADSFVIRDESTVEVENMPVTTIDKLVRELDLERVDFIKMDIEGAEQRALIGARETLARFRPRLALSAYHRPDDPEKIPLLVRQAWPGYRMECGPCAYAYGIIRPDILYFYE